MALHERDLAAGFGEVYLPDALARKYPKSARTWGWQFVFPSVVRSVDLRSGVERRHPLHEASVQRAVREAAKVAEIVKPLRRIPCVIRSPRICCKRDMTFAPSRSCSVTRMYPPR